MKDGMVKFGPAPLAMLLALIACGLVVPVIHDPLTAFLQAPSKAEGYDADRINSVFV